MGQRDSRCIAKTTGQDTGLCKSLNKNAYENTKKYLSVIVKVPVTMTRGNVEKEKLGRGEEKKMGR